MFRSLLLILSLAVVSTAGAALLNLTQTVTRNGETITLRLKREDLRGVHFELWAQNAAGTYDVVTPVGERSYFGTVS